MISFVKYFLLFLMTLVIQVFVLDQAPQLIPYTRPFIFFVFVIALPDMEAVWLMSIAFAGGLMLDFIYGTPGINASACLLLAYLKVPLIKMFKDSEEENLVPAAHLVYLGFTRYFFYILIMSFIFQLFSGFLTVFSFSGAGQTITRAMINTLVSSILIYIFEIIFFYRRTSKS